jgi:hypothetical protein
MKLFDGTAEKVQKRAPPTPPLKLVQNRVMKWMDLRRMHFFRYGSE